MGVRLAWPYRKGFCSAASSVSLLMGDGCSRPLTSCLAGWQMCPQSVLGILTSPALMSAVGDNMTCHKVYPFQTAICRCHHTNIHNVDSPVQ